MDILAGDADQTDFQSSCHNRSHSPNDLLASSALNQESRDQIKHSPFRDLLKGFAHNEPRRNTGRFQSPGSSAMKLSYEVPTVNSPKRVMTRSGETSKLNASIKKKQSSRSRVSKRTSSASYTRAATYDHLPLLPDVLAHGLICVFVGVNPGVATATRGHAYAHPSNSFWKLLHSSGCTDRRLRPEEDRSLPHLYSMGNTNIVERPTKDQSELSKEEMVAGTAKLDSKFLQYKPEAVVIVGKGIWEAIWKYRHGRNLARADFQYGWQEESENMGRSYDGEVLDDQGRVWQGARVFVATSTSGLSASLKPAEKEAIWRPLGEWVKNRRQERIKGTNANNPDSNY